MIKNLLKITIRNIKRYKIYSLINITGFALGLSISLILTLYVIDDLTFDRFHQNRDNIFRVLTTEKSGGQKFLTYSITAGPLLPAITEEIPEVLAYARINSYGMLNVAKGQVDQANLNESNSVRILSLVTDPGFFDIFSFKLLSGDKKNALISPGGVYLTPEYASTLFEDEDPVGQSITIRGLGYRQVKGVVEAPPSNSHIRFGILLPLLVKLNPNWEDSWENLLLSAYILVQKDANIQEVEKKIVKVGKAHNFAEIYNPKLQPLLDIHLGSNHHRYDHRNLGKNDKTIVYSLLVIGLMIILIASINFVNLSSARATRRAKEVGMRKVVGSYKWQLVSQFLGESVILTIIAMFIASVVIQVALPNLETLMGKYLEIDYLKNPLIPLSLVGVAIFVGLISGIYPAFILSSFKPVAVLRGDFYSGSKGVLIRRILVIFQFAISTTLIASVLMVLWQIKYMKSVELGYNRDQVLAIFSNYQGKDLLANKLKTLPAVKSVGRTNYLPGSIFLRMEVIPEGQTRENSRMYQRMLVDHGFIKTLEITLLQGRGYSKTFQADANDSIILNETAARLAGWANPIGKRLDLIEIDGSVKPRQVVGVVKDFHYSNPRQVIEPMMYQLTPQACQILLARLEGGKVAETTDQIEAFHKKLFLNRPVNKLFLDEVFNQQFVTDKKFASNIAIFSGVAIFIACMGLIGLVSFAIEQRRREMAVRKVLGSGERRIVFMLAADFLKWVVYANIIAWPFSYFVMGLWLRGFVYIAPFSPLPYLMASMGALIIALVTLLYQSIKAARANPVDSLKYE